MATPNPPSLSRHAPTSASAALHLGPRAPRFLGDTHPRVRTACALRPVGHDRCDLCSSRKGRRRAWPFVSPHVVTAPGFRRQPRVGRYCRRLCNSYRGRFPTNRNRGTTAKTTLSLKIQSFTLTIPAKPGASAFFPKVLPVRPVVRPLLPALVAGAATRTRSPRRPPSTAANPTQAVRKGS